MSVGSPIKGIDHRLTDNLQLNHAIMKIFHKYSKDLFDGSTLHFAKSIALVMFVGGTLCSCADFLEIDLPNNQLTTEDIFDDYTTAEAALLNTYIQLRDVVLLTGTDTGLGITLGLYSDELDLYSVTSQSSQQFYINTILPTNSSIAPLWNGSYNVIYNLNTLIERVGNSDFTEDQKSAHWGIPLRGLVHFYLVNLFGEIPISKPPISRRTMM